jgi:hypothetical protein
LIIPDLPVIFRAINVPLAHGGEHPCPAVVVIVVGLLRLDVGVDGVRDRPVCAACLVLVDHGRSLTVGAVLARVKATLRAAFGRP